MTDLQMILLISSGLFLAGIYWWGKKTKEQNALKPNRLKQHGFRADTPEEEGMEVQVKVGAGRSQPVDPLLPPIVTARDAWERASHQPVSEPSRSQAVQPPPQSTAQGQVNASIETAINSQADPYLEERFALSEPVMPRESMQAPRQSSRAHQPMHDYGHHQLGDQMNTQNEVSDAHYYQQGSAHHHSQGRSYQDPLGEQEHYIGHSSHHQQNGQQGYEQAYHHDHHYEGYQQPHHYQEPHQHAADHQYYDQYDDYYDDYEAQEPELPTQMFALLVLDPRGTFNRLQIHKTMLGAGLSFSSNGVYVFYDRAGNDSHYIFRVANHNETGFFTDVEDHPEEFSTSGVVLVLEIPNVVTPYRAMNEFIKAARLISQGLGGRLYDANRHVIKESDLKKMRDYAQSITV